MSPTNDRAGNRSITWIDIVLLKEFQQYLNYEELMIISMLSKYIRFKLNQTIFQSIIISYLKFLKNPNFIDDIDPSENIIYDFFTKDNRAVRDHLDCDLVQYYKNFSIDSIIEGLKTNLEKIATNVKKIQLVNLQQLCYYIFPITNYFTNLTYLKLYHCSISLTAFNQISQTLINLEALEMFVVELIQLPDSQLSLQGLDFPPKLLNLNSLHCYVCTVQSNLSPASFLFGPSEELKNREYFPTPIYIPSLRNINFDPPESSYSAYIAWFLNLNRQLESYNLKFEFLDQHIINSIFNLKNTKYLMIKCCGKAPQGLENFVIPKLESIEHLEFSCVCEASAQFLKQICMSCPKLTKMTLKFNRQTDWSSIDDLLCSIASKLIYLITLDIDICHHSINLTQINESCNIKNLIIHKIPTATTTDYNETITKFNLKVLNDSVGLKW